MCVNCSFGNLELCGDSVFKVFHKFMIVKVRFYVNLVMSNYIMFAVIEVCHVKVYWCWDCTTFDSLGLYCIWITGVFQSVVLLWLRMRTIVTGNWKWRTLANGRK